MQQIRKVSLSRCCRLFGISRQGIYQSEKRALEKSIKLELLRTYIEQIRRIMPMLGTRKVHYMLKEELVRINVKIGRDALFAYMKKEGLLIKKKRKYIQTTNSKHWLRKHPKLLDDREIKRIEEVFVSDITYIKSNEGVHYLSLVTDAFSRKIMGYHLSNDMYAASVVKALQMAVKNKVTEFDTIHHSDRGLQYCSALYQQELKRNKITPSMTDGYDCYQNALAERMNGILKQEFLLEHCRSFDDLKIATAESIKIYNDLRPHLSLNMATPNSKHKRTLPDLKASSINY